MKMLKLFIVIICTLTVTACHIDPSKVKVVPSPLNNPNNPQGKISCPPGVDCVTPSVDQTQQSVSCQRPPVAGLQIYGVWKDQRLYNGALSVETTYSILPDLHFMVENTCTQEGITISVVTSALYQMSGNQFFIRNNDNKNNQTTLPSGKLLSCSSKIDTGNYKYSFQGNCLVLTSVGTTAPPIMLEPN